jgi:drug/metabolite transporter (DMT)-like permease
VQDMTHVLFGTPSSYLVWIGILMYTFNFFLWILILSKLDLSTAVPVASTNYVILPVLAVIFLHENISVLRWVGIFFIMLGIHFVSKSTRVPQREP